MCILSRHFIQKLSFRSLLSRDEYKITSNRKAIARGATTNA